MALEAPRPAVVAGRAEDDHLVVLAVPAALPALPPVEHLLEGDHGHRLGVRRRAQRGGEQPVGGLAGVHAHVGEQQAGPGLGAVLEPPPPLVVERADRRRPPAIVERGEERRGLTLHGAPTSSADISGSLKKAAVSIAEGLPPAGSAPASSSIRTASADCRKTAAARAVWPRSLTRAGSAPCAEQGRHRRRMIVVRRQDQQRVALVVGQVGRQPRPRPAPPARRTRRIGPGRTSGVRRRSSPRPIPRPRARAYLRLR